MSDLIELAAARPIVLVGLRAVGKTTVGRVLAELTDRVFIDLDERVLRAARRRGHEAASVGELLTRAGQARFRELEAAALRSVLEPGIRCVLASGGGAVERSDNRVWLARTAVCVWLSEDLKRVAERVRADGASRPALSGGGDAVAELERLLIERTPWYAEVAQLRVAGAGRTAAEIAKEIATELGTAHPF